MTWSYIVSHLAFRIIAPRVDASKLFSSHAMAPSGVDHVVVLAGKGVDLSVQADVSQTL